MVEEKVVYCPHCGQGMNDGYIRITIQSKISGEHLEKLEKKIKTLLENEKVSAKIYDHILGNTLYAKVDERVVYEFGNIDFQILEEQFPNLLATAQHNFPELPQQEIVKICNLTI